MSNETSSPSMSPTIKVETSTPTLNPTFNPTVSQEQTSSPTLSPTPYISTSAPTDQVEIIDLPNYKSKDPVDGIFIIFTIVLILTLFLACFQTFRKNKVRDVDDVERSIREELSNSDVNDREFDMK